MIVQMMTKHFTTTKSKRRRKRMRATTDDLLLDEIRDDDDDLFIPVRSRRLCNVSDCGSVEKDVAELTVLLKQSRIRRVAVVEEDLSELDLSDLDIDYDDDVFEESDDDDNLDNIRYVNDDVIDVTNYAVIDLCCKNNGDKTSQIINET